MNVQVICAGNNNLQDAKKRKNDEFYTRYADIEEELQHYRAFLVGKSILCNCNDANSNFWEYFHRNFGNLGLSRLIATHYDKNNPSYKLEYAGGDDINLEDCHRSRLIPDGDFRSAECIHLLEESDIVVTNPPFSLFREFIAVLMKSKKKFLVIGNLNCITYKDIFPLIKTNGICIGYTSPKAFIQFDGEDKKFGNIVWFTNLTWQQRCDSIVSHQIYEPGKYKKYDNYNAIEVSKITDLPGNYDGVMGLPITFMKKFSPEQYDIIGATESEGRGFSNGLWDPESKVAQPMINGKRIYKRIFIKRKMTTGDNFIQDIK